MSKWIPQPADKPPTINTDMASAINNLEHLLARDFGKDYSFTISARGHIIAKSAMQGQVTVKPIIDPFTAPHRHD